MNEQKIIDSFQNYLKEKGFEEKSLSLSNMPELFIDYYQKVKFDGFNEEDDGDMLLFQYGTYRWQEERYFQVNFTRQFYEVYEDETHQIYQLGITFYYEPKLFEEISAFNKWSLESQNLTDFQYIITNSLGYQRAIKEQPVNEEIVLDLV